MDLLLSSRKSGQPDFGKKISLSSQDYAPLADRTLDALLADDPQLSSTDLAARLLDKPGLVVHPRSIERALARRKKTAR